MLNMLFWLRPRMQHMDVEACSVLGPVVAPYTCANMVRYHVDAHPHISWRPDRRILMQASE
jgi:hypothetical protein